MSCESQKKGLISSDISGNMSGWCVKKHPFISFQFLMIYPIHVCVCLPRFLFFCVSRWFYLKVIGALVRPRELQNKILRLTYGTHPCTAENDSS